MFRIISTAKPRAQQSTDQNFAPLKKHIHSAPNLKPYPPVHTEEMELAIHTDQNTALTCSDVLRHGCPHKLGTQDTW